MEILHEANDDTGEVFHVSQGWAVGGTFGHPLVMSQRGKRFKIHSPPKTLGLRAALALDDSALLVGESGGLFVTRDDGDTWKKVATKTRGCLFSIVRCGGSIWLAGDDGFMLRSEDEGKTWSPPRFASKAKKLGRISRLVGHGQQLWMVSHEGKLGVVRKSSLELIDLDRMALTSVAFSPRGLGIAVGDGGAIMRSNDSGKTWTRSEAEIEADLEDVAWVHERFVIVGDEGTVLTTSDGESFSSVQTNREEHLWSLYSDDGNVVIGGDAGLVFKMTASDLAKGELLVAEAEVDEPEVIADVVRLAETSLSNVELEKASKRWIDEGARYYAALNAYVAQFYSGKPATLKDEPEETRKDMATLVQRAACQLNREGRVGELRRMFPPSYEAFEYEDIGQSVGPAFYLLDGSILVRVGGTKVYRLRGDEVAEIQGVRAIGRSHDRSIIAYATNEHVELRSSEDDALGDETARALPYPASVKASDVLTMSVFPDGKQVLLASAKGIFLLSDKSSTLLHPDGKRAREAGDDLDMSYAHAALSPDGRTIACGDQDSAHRIFVIDQRRFVLAAEIEPASSYPCFALFHDQKSQVLLAACHFSESSALSLELRHLKVLPGKNPKVLRLSGYDGDARLTVVDNRNWIYSGIPRESGWVLGDRNGYAWIYGFDGALGGYLHVGSTMEGMDADPKNEHLLFGTYSGALVEWNRLGDPKTNYRVLSPNIAKGYEQRRWVFWKGFPPLRW